MRSDYLYPNPCSVFFWTLGTGLREDKVRAKLSPLLQSSSVDDAEQMETMKQIVPSWQEQRQKFVEGSKARPMRVQAVKEQMVPS